MVGGKRDKSLLAFREGVDPEHTKKANENVTGLKRCDGLPEGDT